jgi:hypothetical protein
LRCWPSESDLAFLVTGTYHGFTYWPQRLELYFSRPAITLLVTTPVPLEVRTPDGVWHKPATLKETGIQLFDLMFYDISRVERVSDNRLILHLDTTAIALDLTGTPPGSFCINDDGRDFVI